MKAFLKLFSFGFVGFGVSLLIYISWVYLQWGFAPKNQNPSLEGLYLSLLVNSRNLSGTVAGTKSYIPEYKLPRRNFYLTIPALSLTEVKVTANVNSNKEQVYFPVLKESIAHYEGSALPGEAGNVFLYGHSVLPQFFDKKNYLTIFSRLPDLEVGDEITARDGENKFRYVVFDKKVVDPSQIEYVNPQPYDTLTLMTCVPPGLTTKRLLVFARELN